MYTFSISQYLGRKCLCISAAMLELPLAADFPQTALIVTGMRKKVIKEDLCLAFREFGEIEGAAVAPNARGFGKFCRVFFFLQVKILLKK